MTGTGLVRHNDLVELKELGTMLIQSGMFKDVRDVSQAAVKVLAGRELGMGPVESMRAFHVIEGKVEASADLLATLVKQHPVYDYRVVDLTDQECVLEFFQNGDSVGMSSFTMDDRKTAGLPLQDSKGKPTPWAKFPRNMLFARAMSNGVAFHCPDVTSRARVYVDGEVGGEENPPELSVVEVDHPSGNVVVDVGTGEVVGGSVEEATSGSENHDDEEIEPPASSAQLAKLAMLAQELGWSDEERRGRAGVSSFTQLDRATASALISDWTTIAENDPGPSGGDPDEAEPAPPASSAREGSGLEDGPATSEQWTRLLRHVGRGKKATVMVAARKKFGELVSKAEDLTADQAAQLLEEALL